jgi:hypothetical protein
VWVPPDITAIEEAIADGRLEETSSFDGKRELPGPKKNASAAVDIAAMSTAGGVLLYGVGEDEHKRLTVRSPIALVGAADRLDQIAQTSITEVPHVEFREYPLPGDPARGFLLIIVPPSPRAPHQVTVNSDRRFYGRAEKGNRLLSEAEVAALYARRQHQGVDLQARLTEAIAHVPYKPTDQDVGVLYAIAQPVPPDQGLWDRAEIAAGTRAKLQERIHAAARNAAGLVPNGNSGFGGLAHWHAEGADAFRMSSEYEEPPRDDAGNYMTAVTVNIDGRAVLYSPGSSQVIVENAQDTNPLKYIFEPNIAGSVVAFLAAVGELYAAASYYGAVDLGVAVVGLQGGVGAVQFARFNMPAILARRHATAYNASMFTRVQRLSAASELADVQAVTLKLVGRLLQATSLREDYSPFTTAAG